MPLTRIEHDGISTVTTLNGQVSVSVGGFIEKSTSAMIRES